MMVYTYYCVSTIPLTGPSGLASEVAVQELTARATPNVNDIDILTLSQGRSRMMQGWRYYLRSFDTIDFIDF